MIPCAFCKILSGDFDALIIRRGGLTTAFMDRNPVAPGHVLVVPNKHFECMDDAESSYLEELARTSREIGLLQKEKLGATGYNVLVANGRSAQQSVFHLHFHVIPRFDDDSIDLWFDRKRLDYPFQDVEAAFRKLLY